MIANRIRPCLRYICVIALSVLAAGAVAAHEKKPKPQPVADPILEASVVEAATETWGCPMCETVRTTEPGSCPLCKMALVPLVEIAVEHPAGGDVAQAPSKKPLMPGLPDEIFFASIVFILLLSFVLFDYWGRRLRARSGGDGPRWDLFRIPGTERLVRKPWFRFSVQLPIVLLFVVVLYAGLFGNQNAERNIAPVLTWTIWWTWLVIAILFVGKAWCTVCPWMALGDWIERIAFWRRRQWPRRLSNLWLATGMFVGLTWLELGFGVTDKPALTAMLGLFMVGAALTSVLLFQRRAFCRYACLVGRVSGLYAMFSATELRARDREVCRGCKTKDCLHGNADGSPCPTTQFMGSMDRNTYCTLCTECVRSCPHGNIAWNVRPPGADLFELKRVRMDEAYLAVILLSMSAFHGLTMTPNWDRLVGWIGRTTSTGELASFSMGMASMLALPLILYVGVCLMMKAIAGDQEHSVKTLFVRFSYSLLPIALFYHLAHNLQHIFYEGMKLVRIASDPFGWGWDLFGTAGMAVHAVLPADVGWWIQVVLIVVGHIYGILIAHRAAFTLYEKPRQVTLSQLPMLVAMALFSVQSLWLLAQPMVMRTAM